MSNLKPYSKLQRQLIIYHLFCKLWYPLNNEVLHSHGIDISKRTFLRDIKDLTDAGLIHVEYTQKSVEETGYVFSLAPDPFQGDSNVNRMKHLKKLARIALLMKELKDPTITEEYINETDELCVTITNSVIEQYRNLCPACSTRTRQRDLDILRSIVSAT